MNSRLDATIIIVV